jgi:hypothetical protein
MAPQQKKRKTWLWLLMGALLLGLGAWLMRGAEPADRPKPVVNIPTRMTPQEHMVADNRRTWIPYTEVDAGPAFVAKKTDPIFAALPTEIKEVAVVAEFSAIMNSELGGLLADCLFKGNDRVMQSLRDAGIDPVAAIDRVALIDDSLVVTGNFKDGNWKRLLPEGAVARDYGRQGQLIDVKRTDGGSSTFGVWDNQMFVGGDSEEQTKQIIDRLQSGQGQTGPSELDESMAYGDVYGVLKGKAFSGLFDGENEQLGNTLRESAKSVELHMDVGHDLGLSADITGNDPQKSEELRKTLGSALSLARMRAEAKRDTEQASILDMAMVGSAHSGSGFNLRAGLPFEVMQKALKGCVTRRMEKDSAFGDAGE